MVGQVIGGYTVIEKLGETAASELFLAELPGTQQQGVVELWGAEPAVEHQVAARFLRTLHGLSTLGHPSVVAVYGAGFSHDRLFTIKEVVKGESLATLLVRVGNLASEAMVAVALMRQVAGALTAAHELGLFHGHLCAEDVVLVLDLPQEGAVPATAKVVAKVVAKIANFGTAIVAQKTANDAHGPQADCGAIGALLFHLLSGKPPTPGCSPPSYHQPGISRAIDSLAMELLATPDPAASPPRTMMWIRERLESALGETRAPLSRRLSLTGTSLAVSALSEEVTRKPPSFELDADLLRSTDEEAAVAARAEVKAAITLRGVPSPLAEGAIPSSASVPSSPLSTSAGLPVTSSSPAAQPLAMAASSFPSPGRDTITRSPVVHAGVPEANRPKHAPEVRRSWFRGPEVGRTQLLTENAEESPRLSVEPARRRVSPPRARKPGRAAPKSPLRSLPRAWLWIAGVTAAVLTFAVAAVLTREEPARHPRTLRAEIPREPVQNTEPAFVNLRVSSTPPGAELTVGSEPSARGVTPLILKLPRGSRTVDLRLIAPGYLDKVVAADVSADHLVEVDLVPVPETEAPVSAEAGPPSKGPAAEAPTPTVASPPKKRSRPRPPPKKGAVPPKTPAPRLPYYPMSD